MLIPRLVFKIFVASTVQQCVLPGLGIGADIASECISRAAKMDAERDPKFDGVTAKLGAEVRGVFENESAFERRSFDA